MSSEDTVVEVKFAEDEGLSDFMKELAGSDETLAPAKPRVVDEPITEESIDDVLMRELTGVLALTKEVAEVLGDRISAGDNYEGTMMGFAQSTDNLMKSLKFLEARKVSDKKHERELEKMKLAHEMRMMEIEKRGVKSVDSGAKNVTNVFIGSRDEFLKQAQIGAKALDALDV